MGLKRDLKQLLEDMTHQPPGKWSNVFTLRTQAFLEQRLFPKVASAIMADLLTKDTLIHAAAVKTVIRSRTSHLGVVVIITQNSDAVNAYVTSAAFCRPHKRKFPSLQRLDMRDDIDLGGLIALCNDYLYHRNLSSHALHIDSV